MCYRRDSVREVTFLLIVSLLWVAPAIAQSPNATIDGIVFDPSGAAITGAQVVVVNDATGVQYTTKTNGEGIYVVPNLPPGPYRIQVSNRGFKTIIKPDIDTWMRYGPSIKSRIQDDHQARHCHSHSGRDRDQLHPSDRRRL